MQKAVYDGFPALSNQLTPYKEMNKTNNSHPYSAFARILHLAEAYQEQYLERGLCLSPEQKEASFKDYVEQYNKGISSPVINTDIPLF